MNKWFAAPWPGHALIFSGLTFFLHAVHLDAVEFDFLENETFAQPKGETLQLDAFLVPSSQPTPAMIYVHGGGFVSGDKGNISTGFREIRDLLLKSGISVISINYRLAPKHPYPAAPNDVQAGIRYIKKHAQRFRVDPDRLALMGESAGGMLVSHAGAKYEAGNRVAAVVSFYGEHDFTLRVSEDPCAMDGYTKKRPDGGCISNGMADFLGFRELNPAGMATLEDATVVNHVHTTMPPYLLIHGTRDYGVPIEQAHSMHAAMQRVGAECQLVAIVGGGHGGWTEPHQQHYQTIMIEWLLEKLADH